MKITKEMVKYVADLARLDFTDEECENLGAKMEAVISYIDKLNELNTENVEPTAHVLSRNNVFREDVVEKSFDREEILRNAPSHENGCFKVPKVVE